MLPASARCSEQLFDNGHAVEAMPPLAAACKRFALPEVIQH